MLCTLLAQYARTSTGADGNGADSGSGPSQPTTCARSHVQHHGRDGIPVGLTTSSTPGGKRGKNDRNQGGTTGPVEGLIRAGHESARMSPCIWLCAMKGKSVPSKISWFSLHAGPRSSTHTPCTPRERERETFYQKSLNPRRCGKEAEIQVWKGSRNLSVQAVAIPVTAGGLVRYRVFHDLYCSPFRPQAVAFRPCRLAP